MSDTNPADMSILDECRMTGPVWNPDYMKTDGKPEWVKTAQGWRHVAKTPKIDRFVELFHASNQRTCFFKVDAWAMKGVHFGNVDEFEVLLTRTRRIVILECKYHDSDPYFTIPPILLNARSPPAYIAEWLNTFPSADGVLAMVFKHDRFCWNWATKRLLRLLRLFQGWKRRQVEMLLGEGVIPGDVIREIVHTWV